jgi:Domain of unknown function (DUF5680)
MVNKLQEFLVKAHKATYASNEKGVVNESGAEQYNFSEDEFEYIDTYHGGANFTGFEIAKENGAPVWGMSYYGHFLSDDFDKDAFSVFFKSMLSKTTPGILVRGPKKWKKKEWSYRYSFKGSFGDFSAEEIIRYKGKKVFQTRLNGGLIKQ